MFSINEFFYIDVVFTPSPGEALDYESILDSDPEFTLTIGGQLVTVSGEPIPIEMVFEKIDHDNDTDTPEIDGALIANEVGDGITGQELYSLLANEGIQRFRYLIDSGFTATAYEPGTVEIDFAGGTWVDSAGNTDLAANLTFTVTGVTAELLDAGDIDLGALNARNYIDVTFPDAPAGFSIDFDSITDLDTEIELSGAGLGDVVVDESQAPVVLNDGSDGNDVVVRYWFSGNFVAGDVTMTLLPQTWSFIADANTANGSQQMLMLNSARYVDVTFDNIPADFEIDPASITDLAAEFTISTSATGKTVALDSERMPLQLFGDNIADNTYRFYFTDTSTVESNDRVTLDFTDQSWSFTDNTQIASSTNAGDLTATNVRSYLDITFTPTNGATIDPAQIEDADNEFTITGSGLGFASLDASETPLNIGGDTYRFFITGTVNGTFTTGDVIVEFQAGTVTDSSGFTNLSDSQDFTAQGPTAALDDVLADVENGGVIGLQTINGNKYIDVKFTPTSGADLDPASIDGNEFTLSGSGLGTVVVDSSAPTGLGDNVFRYALTGDFVSGEVVIDFTAGSFQDSNTITNLASSYSVTVQQLQGVLADPVDGVSLDKELLNDRGYIDIDFVMPNADITLDIDSVIDLDAEFTLSVDNEANNGTLILSTDEMPLFLGVSGDTYTFRYFYEGTFVGGDVTLGKASCSAGDSARS